MKYSVLFFNATLTKNKRCLLTRYIYYVALLLLCAVPVFAQSETPYLLVLGIAQDGGYPHIGCTKKCCTQAWEHPATKRHVVSLALVDPGSRKWWLFEATPDIKDQLHDFQVLTKGGYNYLPDGIFITHAHIGHYAGLMELGREVMNTKDVPVYVMPKMKTFLETNGPWSQLVTLHNIALRQLNEDSVLQLPDGITIKAFTVPHRDEYSETAGFSITTAVRKYVFIPDINKWDKWQTNIVDVVKGADVALLDATFYNGDELPGRNMSEVPHPFVVETMELFKNESPATKARIHFIHFNHTNPVMWDSAKRKEIQNAGFHIAEEGERL